MNTDSYDWLQVEVQRGVAQERSPRNEGPREEKAPAMQRVLVLDWERGEDDVVPRPEAAREGQRRAPLPQVHVPGGDPPRPRQAPRAEPPHAEEEGAQARSGAPEHAQVFEVRNLDSIVRRIIQASPWI